jgi:hypothetical protein
LFAVSDIWSHCGAGDIAAPTASEIFWAGTTFHPDTGKFGSAAVSHNELAVVGTLAADPFLPGKLTKVAGGAHRNEANGLPTPTIGRPVDPGCMKIEAPQPSGLGVPVPSREAQSWNIQQRIGRCCIAAADSSVIGWKAESIDAQQGGKSWLKPLEFGAVCAGQHSSKGLVPAHEPVI